MSSTSQCHLISQVVIVGSDINTQGINVTPSLPDLKWQIPVHPGFSKQYLRFSSSYTVYTTDHVIFLLSDGIFYQDFSPLTHYTSTHHTNPLELNTPNQPARKKTATPGFIANIDTMWYLF